MVCYSTKAAISLKRVQIEKKLLWRTYINSPTLFPTAPSPTPYGLLFPKIEGSLIQEKLLWRAYRNSRTLFPTAPSPTPYGLLFPKIQGSLYHTSYSKDIWTSEKYDRLFQQQLGFLFQFPINITSVPLLSVLRQRLTDSRQLCSTVYLTRLVGSVRPSVGWVGMYSVRLGPWLLNIGWIGLRWV